MKEYFGYTRVSTTKQGEHGVSLSQQREAIETYALRHQLKIGKWFEEQETAAKHGRPIFNQMLVELHQGAAVGIIIHKIDRSARNLRDWVTLGDLVDIGIELHFANEAVDLQSRGGRLSADIQAVVATDYIRNLREETIKGFYGRLKQGISPLPAPVGYLNPGAGKPKTVDPLKGALVRQAFELYSTGEYSLFTLASKLYEMGLRGRKGSIIGRNALGELFRNPFYIGKIRIQKKNTIYPGAHKPLISSELFDRVQEVLNGKYLKKKTKHWYLFQRFIKCGLCKHSLIPEMQKGHIYYRCQTRNCETKTIREERISDCISSLFSKLEITDAELFSVRTKIEVLKKYWSVNKKQLQHPLQERLDSIAQTETRLVDAYVERLIEKSVFEQRKNTLASERQVLEEKIRSLETANPDFGKEVEEFLELAKKAYLAHQSLQNEEVRQILPSLTSNRTLSAKNLVITLSKPFSDLASAEIVQHGGPQRARSRMFWMKFIRMCTESRLRGLSQRAT